MGRACVKSETAGFSAVLKIETGAVLPVKKIWKCAERLKIL
jgi:hypothetical protein